jgi:hypothetical protein
MFSWLHHDARMSKPARLPRFGVLLGSFVVFWIATASASLRSADDPRFGMNALTLDTASGLAWLNLLRSTNLSYEDVTLATQPGGVFEGFRYATPEEVFGLFRHAEIASGFVLESSDEAKNVSSLISLLGSTSSQDGRNETFGISGTSSGEPWHGRVVMGLDFFFGNGVPGYLTPFPSPTLIYADTTSYPEVGNWLVRVVPEPGIGGFAFAGALILASSAWRRRPSV